MNLDPLIAKHSLLAAGWRHAFHQIPEIGYQEFKTASFIRAQLDALGIKHVSGVTDAPTATIAWIGDTSKACIALRADIDALPIVERTGLPYASTHPGMMHACGHDGHTATLLGTAGVLKSLEDRLPVCVKLIWQPAEEEGAGAARLVKAGVLDGTLGPKVNAIFGLHGWPGLKVGMVATKAGPLLAATDSFTAEFIGHGAHGAFPHTGRDPIVAACEAVLSLQSIVSREVDPTDSAVVHIGIFNAGTAVNVIPDSAVIKGTARTLTPASRRSVVAAIKRRCEGVAAANDCRLRLQHDEGYPATCNDPAMADLVAKVARGALGASGFLPTARPAMGGEDFACYLQKVPGCFFMVGVEPADAASYPGLHNDHYDFTDGALVVGMRMFVELAISFGK